MVKTAENPIFSIIVPTFNRADKLRGCIASIISQSFTDWELIIIDDGSTDKTNEVVHTYKDVRLRYVLQENQERSAARNHGLELATGEWICFLDSDDEYAPTHLEVLYKCIKAYPKIKAFRTKALIRTEGKIILYPGDWKNNKYTDYPVGCFTAATFKKSILHDIKFETRYFIHEDQHFFIRVLLRNEIKLLPDQTLIVNYDPVNKGILGAGYEKILLNKRACLHDILSWNKSLIIPYLKRERCFTEILMLYGHFKHNRKRILHSLFHNLAIFGIYPVEYFKLIKYLMYSRLKANKLFIF